MTTATFEQFVAQQDAKNTIQLNVNKWCYMLIDALKQNYTVSAINGHKNSIRRAKRDENIDYHLIRIKELKNGDCSIDYIIESGRKYHKIILVDSGGSRSVHCFVDKKTGEVYKSASWRSPAKGVRYDLRVIKEREFVLANADWSGGYLYMDNVVGFNYKRG
jgi:hypothetical protein